MDIKETLTELRSVIDEREQLNATVAALTQRKTELETALRDYHTATGVEGLKGSGMSISFTQKMRAKYEADKWPEIVKWAVATGNDHIIQRRLTDAKLLELVDHGVALPAGLSLEGYTDVSARRI